MLLLELLLLGVPLGLQLFNLLVQLLQSLLHASHLRRNCRQ
jgi:hypothetical protein